MNKIITGATAAAFALILVATPALADVSKDTVTVDVYNYATVENAVESAASTGGNVANGAEASNVSKGGNIEKAGKDNKAGNGGNKVLGGWGGVITTGDATANASVSNTLNDTTTEIDLAHSRCDKDPCDDKDHKDHSWNDTKDDFTVTVKSDIDLRNKVRAFADTGYNEANGSQADNTSKGGNVSHAGDYNTGGNGGNHVEGGSGGEITTGKALSNSSVVNVLNKTITRIRR